MELQATLGKVLFRSPKICSDSFLLNRSGLFNVYLSALRRAHLASAAVRGALRAADIGKDKLVVMRKEMSRDIVGVRKRRGKDDFTERIDVKNHLANGIKNMLVCRREKE